MTHPEPGHRSLPALVHEIEKGVVKIPQFQRDFVWERSMCARLLDSILRGFPIGTFILWRTREQLGSLRNIGHLSLKPVPDGEYAEQVLDGQQRLTCLYAAARGAVVRRERNGRIREDRFADMYVDLDADPETDAPIVVLECDEEPANGSNNSRYIRFMDVLSGAFPVLRKLADSRASRAHLYSQAAQSYQFPVVLLKDAPLEIATEVFERINVGGKRLTPFEIMVAKTFRPADPNGKGEFDLDKEFKTLARRLADVEYETIDASSVLQVVSLLIVGECGKADILKLNADRFREVWPGVRNGVECTCDYLREVFGAKAARLLPYSSLLIPFAFYFVKSGRPQPAPAHAKWLQEFFWRVALSGRYAGAAETKVANDCRLVAKLLAGQDAEQPSPVAISAEVVRQRGHFGTGRAFIKACLCMLVLQGPKKMNSGTQVKIENDWLKQANSKNFHHFFPKAMLRKKGVDRRLANHIANITIVDDYMNKRLVGTRAPSDYIASFRETNPQIAATLRTHLIELKSDGVLDDDYDKFFLRRSKAIADQLREYVPIRPIDAQAGVVVDDEEPDDQPESGDD